MPPLVVATTGNPAATTALAVATSQAFGSRRGSPARWSDCSRSHRLWRSVAAGEVGMPRTYADLAGGARPASDPGGDLLARAFGARHLRAVEPPWSGACGEGPMWTMGVTLGVSIMGEACSLDRGRLVREGPRAAP